MINVEASETFEVVDSVFYDGIYTFVGVLDSEVDGSTLFRIVAGESTFDVSNGGNLPHQVAFQVWLNAGNQLEHKGPALSLYGVRTSDEL